MSLRPLLAVAVASAAALVSLTAPATTASLREPTGADR